MKQYFKSTLITVQGKEIIRYLEVENDTPTRHVKLQNGTVLQKSEILNQQLRFFKSERSYFNNWVVISQKEFENAWNA